MADIVEKLRAVLVDDPVYGKTIRMTIDYDMVAEAADEIERLRRCLSKQPNTHMIAFEDGRHEELADILLKARDEIERLRAALSAILRQCNNTGYGSPTVMERMIDRIEEEAIGALGPDLIRAELKEKK